MIYVRAMIYKQVHLFYAAPTHTSTGVSGRYCSTSSEYKLTEEQESRLLFYGGWSAVECGCTKQCNEDIYTMYTEAAQGNPAHAKIRVFFQVRKNFLSLMNYY